MLPLVLCLILPPSILQLADTPGDLVGRLGAARFADREDAAAKLVALGEAALPAIEAATESPDPEIRARAGELRSRVEAEALRRPTRIRLDFDRLPIGRVLDDFDPGGRCRLALTPEASGVRGRVVSLREPGPLPFWSAVDRLCRAADLRYEPADPAESLSPRFRLPLRQGHGEAPHAESGPARLEVAEVVQSRQVTLTPGHPGTPEAPANRDGSPPFGSRLASLTVRMRLLVEPHLLVRRIGDASVARASDQDGKSLLAGPAPLVEPWGQTFIPSCPRVDQLLLHLSCPPDPLRSIAKLEVVVPIEVVALRERPIVLPLVAGGQGAARAGRGPIRFEGIDMTDPSFPVVRLHLAAANRPLDWLAVVPDPERWREEIAVRPVQRELNDAVLQVRDDRGRIFPWAGWPTLTPAESGSLVVLLRLDGRGLATRASDRSETPPRGAAPAQVTYFEYARAILPARFSWERIDLSGGPGR